MPHGTANGRLRQSLLFHLVQRLGENICYKCQLPIETSNELSVEHKLPWQHADNAAELFFDLTNISFSHRKCNRPHRPHLQGMPQKYVPEPGFAWCCAHQDFIALERFAVSHTRSNGLNSKCQDCTNRLKRESRAKAKQLNGQ